MTSDQARSILALYRGRAEDTQDLEIREALELAERDPELKRWMERHLAFHEAMRSKMRQVQVPAELKEALLARRKSAKPAPWWRLNAQWWEPLAVLWQKPAWAAAALFVVLGAVVVFQLKSSPTHDRFLQFQTRMVGTALRQYRMDIVTNDMHQVRQFMASRGAPADYEVPRGLERLSLTGGGALKWRNNPVAMVCFDRGDKQMLYLFVAKRDVIKDPPPEKPRIENVRELAVVSWTEGDKTYLLTGPAEPDFERKYAE